MPSLLFVEDNEDLLLNLQAWFEPQGYDQDFARDGAHALELIKSSHYDCIVLDIMLPRLNGFELCRKLRELNISTPVIMLTARDSVEDRVRGLELGADDYLIKPFSLRELQARIAALLRRGQKSKKLTFGPLKMDAAQIRVWRGSIEIRPGPTGFRILEMLIRAAPNVVTRREIEHHIWGEEPPGPGALRNHILELRRALDRPFDFDMLETVPHQGYRLRDAGK